MSPANSEHINPLWLCFVSVQQIEKVRLHAVCDVMGPWLGTVSEIKVHIRKRACLVRCPDVVFVAHIALLVQGAQGHVSAEDGRVNLQASV